MLLSAVRESDWMAVDYTVADGCTPAMEKRKTERKREREEEKVYRGSSSRRSPQFAYVQR